MTPISFTYRRQASDLWTLMPGSAGPRCPSSCRARIHVNPDLGDGRELLSGCLLPSASILAEITLRPGSLSWGREEYNFLIVQSISFPAAGLNLFLSEVLSVCINHLSLYVFVAVATGWLIEFQSVFLDFILMIKSRSAHWWESEQRQRGGGSKTKMTQSPALSCVPEQCRADAKQRRRRPPLKGMVNEWFPGLLCRSPCIF